ncbi:hypothetical protein [Pedobacter miscanthi]|uniref:hypothetical protein n=1 Tax=Pedobacter miscanthi TaxID=2259170 RepID=UPI00292E1B86|nr:hypothetical protein [Pedobacter miscanthi]
MTHSEKLADWVAEKHSRQFIKGTGLPYFEHLNKVALLAKDATKWGYEIGLCHDLLEDTNTTGAELKAALLSFAYPPAAADFITVSVIELTDVFTKSAYPGLNKKERKKLESKRLQTLSAAAQTVKYADLIDNVAWMMQYDLKHASAYLKKKLKLLQSLNRGNKHLRQQAITIIQQDLLSF